MASSSRAAILVGLLLTTPLVAQEGSKQEGRKAGAAFGRVVRTKGRVLVELPGKGWNPLKPDQLLRNGQRIKVGKRGSLELTVADNKTWATSKQAYAGDRVIVDQGSILRVGPPGTRDALSLEQGQLFAQSLRELKIRLGVSVLELGPADAHVSVKKGGKAAVVIQQGKGSLEVPDRRLKLSAGDRVRLTPTGEVKLGKTKVRVPKFVLTADSLTTAKTLLYRERFQSWKWSEERQELWPVPTTGNTRPYEGGWFRAPPEKARRRGLVFGQPAEHIEGLEKKLLRKGTGPMEVRLGRSTPQGGLMESAPGAVLRVTYRVDVGPRVRLRLTNTNYGKGPPETQWLPGRTKLWTVVEFPLDSAFRQKSPLTYISFDAGADGKKCKLEVREFVAYVPEGAGP